MPRGHARHLGHGVLGVGDVLEHLYRTRHLELAVLEDLGFGLDLSACAATGSTTDLTHISPKTGRAVSRTAAQPYLDRLLPLPSFLTTRGNASPHDIADALRLTGHFLEQQVWGPRQIEPSPTRELLAEILSRED